MTMNPRFFTFDVFGTVLDWQAGIGNAIQTAGHSFTSGYDMDRVIDFQGNEERTDFRDYRTITKNSLLRSFDISESFAENVGANAGKWPLFADSREGLKALMEVAPCVAMTNSDCIHGEQIQTQLGYKLNRWICAEETRVYKPDPAFWSIVARASRVTFDRSWWHVSAYSDYDLEVARELGLTCVFVRRPHSRPGFHHIEVPDLLSLARLVRTGEVACSPPWSIRVEKS